MSANSDERNLRKAFDRVRHYSTALIAHNTVADVVRNWRSRGVMGFPSEWWTTQRAAYTYGPFKPDEGRTRNHNPKQKAQRRARRATRLNRK